LTPSVDGRDEATAAAVTSRTLPDIMPMSATLDIRFGQLNQDWVVGEMDWQARLCTAGGVLHGGALVTLADSVAGVCAYLNIPAGAVTSTIELKVNFFAPVRQGTVRAVARPLSVGRSVVVVQTDLQLVQAGLADGEHPAVGIVVQSQIVLG